MTNYKIIKRVYRNGREEYVPYKKNFLFWHHMAERYHEWYEPYKSFSTFKEAKAYIDWKISKLEDERKPTIVLKCEVWRKK